MLDRQVSTAAAAEISGWNYHALRDALQARKIRRKDSVSMRRAGLIEKADYVGALSPLAEGQHRRFSFADLCALTLARHMLDLGLPFEQVNAFVSKRRLWQGARAYAVLAIGAAGDIHFDTVNEAGLVAKLAEHEAHTGGVPLITVPLHAIRSRVRSALESLRGDAE